MPTTDVFEQPSTCSVSAEAVAIVGAAVGLLAVLVPLMLYLHGRLAADLAATRGDVAEVRRGLHALAERVARIEGAMTGPWRPPANGTPAPKTSSPSEETE